MEESPVSLREIPTDRAGRPDRVLLAVRGELGATLAAALRSELAALAPEIEVCSNADWAATTAAAPPFDVVLLDDLLPATAAHLRALPRPPEILLLAEGATPSATAALAAGVPVLKLPLLPGELATAVRAAAEKRRLRSAAERAEQLETLRKTALAITSTLERGALLRTILEGAVQLLGAQSGGIYEYYPEREELTVIAEYGRPENLGITLPVGEGIAGRLVVNGAPFMITSDYERSEWKTTRYEGQGFGAVLEVPLRWRERVIGILYVDDVVGREFREEEAARLGLFADQAAIALANSNLLARNEARQERLKKLAQSTQEIMADLRERDLDERLDLIARHVAAIMEAEVAGVLLVRRSGFLSLEASYGHRPGGFVKGREFAIVSGPGTGLTGHIAAAGELFNRHGVELSQHFAVRGERAANPSEVCYSLLAIPLKKKTGDQESLVGLLRAENKKDSAGRPHPSLAFTREDEEIIKILAEAVVVALELSEQRDWLNRLVASSPDGIIAIDDEGRVTRFNERAQAVLGYTEAEVLGTDVSRLYVDPEEPRKIGKLLHGSPEGRVTGYETGIRAKSGESIPIRHASTWLYNYSGQERIGSVGYFEDLRERDSLLAAYGIVARAKSLDEGMTDLTSMMASLLPHTFCRILLMDEDKTHLDVKAVHVAESVPPEAWATLASTLRLRMVLADWPGLERRLESGRPSLLHWSREEDRSPLSLLSRWLQLTENLQSVLLSPLRLEEKIVGLIELGEIRGREEHPFTPAERDFAALIAAHTTALIDRLRLYDVLERRSKLLETLAEVSLTMRGEKETPKLFQQLVRQAVKLVSGTAGALFLNRPRLEELELDAVHAIPSQPEWIDHGKSQSHYEGLVGEAVRTAKTQRRQGYDTWEARDRLFRGLPFKAAVAVPLRSTTGDVEAVLFVADATGQQPFGPSDLDVLERFAAQASIALHISRLMTPESRSLGHLQILHKLSDALEREKDFDKIWNIVLTGITASYGLGFNRAALLLYDESAQTLTGCAAVGHLFEKEARKDWETGRQSGPENFGTYLAHLEAFGIPQTPLGSLIPKLSLRVSSTDPDFLSRVVLERRCLRVQPHELWELTGNFRSLFQPTTELVIVPLEARGQLRGLVVADNKFTNSPITPESIDTLITFINTFSIIVDNHQLLDETTLARERLQACFEASNAIALSRSPGQVLRDIVEQSPRVAAASWARLVLIDALGNVKDEDEMVAGLQKEIYRVSRVRSHGLSMRAMHSRKAVKIEDARTEPDASPFITENQIAAALCMPLLLQGSPIGVMWINYNQPRRFQKSEIEALQLYVNQAAMAYENARRMADLESLNRAAQEISKASKLTEVLHTIAHQAIAVCQAESAVLWPYDPARQTFVTDEAVAAQVTPAEFHALHEIKQIGEPLGTAIGRQRWLAVPDVRDQSDLVPPALQELLLQAGVASFQAIALQVGEELEGVLYLDYNKVRGFDDRDRRLLETFGSHAALSLKNVRLFERVHRAKAAAGSVAHMMTLESREDTLPSIARSTRDAVGCDAVVLFAYDHRNGRWSYPPAHVGVDHPEKAWPPGREEEIARGIVATLIERDGPCDISHEEIFQNRKFAHDERIVSCVAAPLTAAGQKMGVMFVNYRTQHHFPEESLSDIGLFADQAAVAIRNAQLFGDQLRALHDVAKRVSMNIRLFASLIRGEKVPVARSLLPMEKLVRLLLEGANATSFLRDPNDRVSYIVDQDSFLQSGVPALWLDPDLIENALNNVLDNAFKYSFPMTQVRIRGRSTASGAFAVSIVNQGIPILPSEVEKCLVYGWQSEAARSVSSEGQGIGLWLVANIIQAMGGGIEIKPTTRGGDTEILLLLPVGPVP